MVGLLDGSYLVIFDDNDATPGLRGRRLSEAGIQIGDEFTIAEGDTGRPDAERLDDGRVAVTFTGADGEIRMEILDIRDEANVTGVYTPEDWQIGTIGDDAIVSDGDVFFVGGTTATTPSPLAAWRQPILVAMAMTRSLSPARPTATSIMAMRGRIPSIGRRRVSSAARSTWTPGSSPTGWPSEL